MPIVVIVLVSVRSPSELPPDLRPLQLYPGM
jgi:hypothetical protein